MEFSVVHYSADDANVLLSDYSLKKLKRDINRDLKLRNEWICAKKLSLNVSQTEINIFKPKNKNITK